MGAWLREERAELAIDRLLDAAGEAFEEHGPQRARMEHVARAARCSRGTLYRYFATREALEQAYVAREASRIGARIAERVATLDAPADRLVEALRCAVAEVRARPTLAAWFAPEAAGGTARMALASAAVRELAGGFLAELLARASERGRLRPGVQADDATAWVVRVVLSLLTLPPADDAEEERLLRAFLVPALFAE